MNSNDEDKKLDPDLKNNWSLLNNNLSSALKTWDELTHETIGKVSPDEEKLQEIKKILKDLQKRIDEFR